MLPENENNQAQTQTEGGSGTTETTASDAWMTDEIKSAMTFDPFTNPADEVVVAATDAGLSTDGGQTAQPVSVTQAQPQTAAPEAPAAHPQQVQPVTYTQEQVEQLLQSARTQAQTQATAPAKAVEADDPLTIVPEYNYTVPDQLVTSLASEDPAERKQALGHLIKGVAIGIHQTVANAVLQRLQTLERNIPETVQQKLAYTQQAQGVMSDFYGKFPQLNSPELRPLVAAAAQQHMATTGQRDWSPKLRDEIGQLVLNRLSGVVATQQPPAVAQPQPAMFGGNTSAGNVRMNTPGPKTQHDHMKELFEL